MPIELPIYLNVFSLFYLGLLLLLSIQKFQRVNRAMRQLLLILLCMLPVLLNNVLVLNGKITVFPLLFFLAQVTSTFFVIFFMRHIHFTLEQPSRWLHPLNIVSYVFMTIAMILGIRFELLTNQEQVAYFDSFSSGELPVDFQYMNAFFFLIYLIYFAYMGRIVFKKIEVKDARLATLFRERSAYVRRFWGVIVGLYLTVLLSYVISNEFEAEYFYLPLMINIGFFYIAMNARQYNTTYATDDEGRKEAEADRKKARSNPIENIPQEELNETVSQVKKLLTEEKVYLDSNYSLESLANQIGIAKYKLSPILKDEFELSFTHLINLYRIEHAKKRIENFQVSQDTYEGIGYEVGFNSKASFYRAFKKFTATTPTEFHKQFQ